MKHLEQNLQDQEYLFPYHYIPQFSPGYTHAYTWPWGLHYVSGMEFLLEKIISVGPSSIADLGTGDGRFVRELSKTLPDARIVGIDYSERAIALAKAMNPNLSFLCRDICSAPIGETFDLLTLIEVFEHIPPIEADNFVAALRPLLSDNGLLLVTVPHKNAPLISKHFRHFTSEDLKESFEAFFDVEEVVFLDRQSISVTFIKSVLQNKLFILNHWGIRNRLYRAYKKHHFTCDETECRRIFMSFRPKTRRIPV